MTTRQETHELNRDPISGVPGAHPLGTGAGAAGAAVTGAVIGAAIGGPVGFVVGGAVGAVAGGMTGHDVAELVNPTAEDAYWRGNYATRPYVAADRDYSFYEPAYRYGWEARSNRKGRTWNEVENELDGGWLSRRGASTLEWNEAKRATFDAWSRLDGVTL